MALLLLIITPLIFALLSFFPKKSFRALAFFSISGALIEFGSVIFAGSEILRKGAYSFGHYWSIDSFSWIVILTVAFVGGASSFYSVGYLKEEIRKEIIGFRRARQYFVLLNLFLGAMYVASITSSPLIMWIAIEATTLSTAFLISFYGKPAGVEAAWKYLLINSVGLLLGFFGTLLFFTSSLSSGTDAFISWQTLADNARFMDPLIAKMAFIFALVGYGTKVGLAPMHTWLPDAHSKAPSPISAILSGSLLNVAFLAVLRFKFVTSEALGGSDFTSDLLIFFGIISVIITSFIILAQKNYKRLFAYSSIEHMGIMALGFGFGGIGIFAAILHMIYHSLGKAVLFFSAGNILLKYSSTKIGNVKGVLFSLPATAVILFLGFLAVAGVPPFGIFITEIYMLSAGIISHPIAVSLMVISLALAFVGFLRHISHMIFDVPQESVKRGEFNRFTFFPPIILLAVLFYLSVFLPDSLLSIINSAVLLIR